MLCQLVNCLYFAGHKPLSPKPKDASKPRTHVLRVHSKRGTKLSTSPEEIPKNAVAKIGIQTDKAKNVTVFTIHPAPGKEGQAHSFQINTSNFAKVRTSAKHYYVNLIESFPYLE